MISLGLLKDIPADATVDEIVKNILKITQTFGNIAQYFSLWINLAILKVSVLVFPKVSFVLMVNVALRAFGV